VKSSQRLDYHRLAEALVERGLVTADTVNHVLQQCAATGTLLPDVLVAEDLVSDWELSRVCCEVFGLPFVDIESYPPSSAALAEIDPEFLRVYGIVPLDRYGQVLTVAMPGIVPTEVLEAMAGPEVRRVLPLVSTIASTRGWLQQNLPSQDAPSLEEIKGVLPSGDEVDLESWAGIFDAGEEAVQLELREQDPEEE